MTGLSSFQVVSLLLYAVGMTAGQILFKLAANKLDRGGDALALGVSAINLPFVAGMALYVGLAGYWVWLVSFTPLSRAYPFAALAFVLVPIAAWLLFHEPMTTGLWVGTAAIVIGVVIISVS